MKYAVYAKQFDKATGEALCDWEPVDESVTTLKKVFKIIKSEQDFDAEYLISTIVIYKYKVI